MSYSVIQGRPDLSVVQLPEQYVNEIIQTAPEASVMLARARKTRMSAKTSRQPVLATLPDAYWVNGDTGMKQTTKVTWTDVTMTAEELAVIVPIPDALIDDANIPLWNQTRPLIVEALGKAVDQACFFGINKPASWPTAVIPAAIAAGNTRAQGTGDDIGVDVAHLGEMLALDGFSMSGFASRPGLQWSLVQARDGEGRQVYSPPQGLAVGQPGGLYGLPINEVTNGTWDASTAVLLGADWSKFIIGIRQDVTFDLFSEGVISDDTGKVILNLMQQDTKALRVVFRLGFQVANPLTRVHPSAAGRYPAAVLTPDLTPAP